MASVTVAVAVVVEAPSATIPTGLRDTDTAVAGPGICVRVAEPEMEVEPAPAVAVTVNAPDRVVDLIVVWKLPGDAPAFVLLMCCPPETVNATAPPGTGLPWASVSLAVAVDVDVPSAVIDAGDRDTVTLVAGPAVCVNVAVADRLEIADLSVAVIVPCPAVVVDVIVAWYVPGVEPAVTDPTC